MRLSQLWHEVRLVISPSYRKALEEDKKTALAHLYWIACHEVDELKVKRLKLLQSHQERATVTSNLIQARNEMLRLERIIKERGFYDEVA